VGLGRPTPIAAGLHQVASSTSNTTTSASATATATAAPGGTGLGGMSSNSLLTIVGSASQGAKLRGELREALIPTDRSSVVRELSHIATPTQVRDWACQ